MRRTVIIAVTSFAAIALVGGLLGASGAFAANTTTVGGHAALSQPQAASTPGAAASTPSSASSPAAAGTSVTSGATTAPNTGTGPGDSGISPMVWISIAGVGVVALGLMSAGWYTARRKD
ncbi:MAG TPA: hypothetical protein VFY79_00515 [Dehalococcoidia bacterium]|jgi:hypothetical protein|nr:hypothetical protein [Dehalococcoidia bacterium]